MRSIHRRLVLVLTGALALTLLAGGVVTWFIVRQQLAQEFDRGLFRDLCNVVPQGAVSLWQHDRRGGAPSASARPAADPGLLRGVWLQVWDEAGTEVFRSPNLGAADLPRQIEPRPPMSTVAPDRDGVVFADHVMRGDGGGRHLRVVQGWFTIPAPHGLTFPDPTAPAGRERTLQVALAHDLEAMARPLRTLGWLMLWISIGALAAASVATRLAVNSGLAPLDRLGRQIEALQPGRLDQGCDLPDAPRELTPIRDQLNDMLARLQVAFRSEQEFAANAAHELGTPLAGLRATIEVALQRPRAPEHYQESLGACLAMVQQMQATVKALVELVRVESGRLRVDSRAVDLADVFAASWDEVRTVAPPGAACRGEVAGTVWSEPSMLRRVLANVLGNAVRHGDGDAVEVEVESTTDGDRTVLRVRNHASSVPADLAHRAFDAFWRGDPAHGDRDRVGLGLTLCRRLLACLGGSIEIDARPAGSGAVVEVRIGLPRRG